MPDTQTYNEDELLKRIAEGDEMAFTSLFRRYALSLGLLASQVLKDEAAGQDVLQEVFIRVWLHRDQLPGIGHLPAWLKRVTLNESLQWLRKNVAHDKRLAALPLPEPAENTALQTLDVKTLQNRVGLFIQQMPEQRRMIYMLNRGEGLTTKEIAEKLKLSHGHVRNVLSIAMNSIREHLGSFIGGLFLLLYFFL